MTSSRDVSDSSSQIKYSLCTLVTKPIEYQEMIEAFAAKGFKADDCEYLHIDNSNRNELDAFSGYNRFLSVARGQYIILLHQDLVLLADDRARLDACLSELSEVDPAWGLCGNAGASDGNRVAYRISDPLLKKDSEGGPFPVKVMSLDENFIVVRRAANLALSRDLSGFHWYGSDLCLIADVLGWNAYVIDFHLFHKSGGYQDNAYRAIRRDLSAKYRRAFRTRWYYAIGTYTHRPTLITGSSVAAIWSFTLGMPFKIIVALNMRRAFRKARRIAAGSFKWITFRVSAS